MPEGQSQHGMDCPVCRVDLLMTNRDGVEIDYCPRCRGVWLDRGELDKIIERGSAPQANERSGGYDERPRRGNFGQEDERQQGRGGGERQQGRGGWLDNLFDFGGD